MARGMRSGGGGPLTVQDIRDAIEGLDGDVEITFGSTVAAVPLVFYRFKWRGDKLLSIELNEEFPEPGTYTVIVSEDGSSYDIITPQFKEL